MLRSDLCDFSDVYIVVKGVATVAGALNRDKKIETFYYRIIHHLFLAFQK